MSIEEVYLDLPWDVIDAGKGLSLDIGGSVIKMLYLHKVDWVEPSKRKENSTGRLRLVNFAREVLNEAVSYVKTNVHIIRKTANEAVQIFSTGIGGSQFKKTIMAEFNVTTTNIPEMDCFIHACVYLMKNIPRKELIIDLHHPSYEKARRDVDQYFSLIDKMKDMSAGHGPVQVEKPELHEPRPYTADRDKPIAEEPSIFPCMMIMCGSGFGAMQINEDGSFTLAEGSSRGGRMFLGLGSLLTGTKTFEELMELAAKGNALNVGLSNTALDEGMVKDEKNPYSLYTEEGQFDEQMAFYFGRAVGKTIGDFKKEDLARCLLEMTIQDLVSLAYSICTDADIKNVIFTGGFVNNPLVRQIISKEWLNMDVNMAMSNQKPVGQTPFYFLKHGSHLGALGGYLNSKLHFISDSGKLQEES